jgi:hypothetical protein
MDITRVVDDGGGISAVDCFNLDVDGRTMYCLVGAGSTLDGSGRWVGVGENMALKAALYTELMRWMNEGIRPEGTDEAAVTLLDDDMVSGRLLLIFRGLV